MFPASLLIFYSICGPGAVFFFFGLFLGTPLSSSCNLLITTVHPFYPSHRGLNSASRSPRSYPRSPPLFCSRYSFLLFRRLTNFFPFEAYLHPFLFRFVNLIRCLIPTPFCPTSGCACFPFLGCFSVPFEDYFFRDPRELPPSFPNTLRVESTFFSTNFFGVLPPLYYRYKVLKDTLFSGSRTRRPFSPLTSSFCLPDCD